MSGAVIAAECQDDVIDGVSSDGATIEMRSHKIYDVEAEDRRIAATWTPNSDMFVCRVAEASRAQARETFKLLNRDIDGLSVLAHLIER